MKALFASLCLGLFIFADAPAFASDAFVTASIAEPSNLIPFFATDTASSEISRLVFNGLVKYDKDLKLVGDLASDWRVSPDGLEIVFRLRAGVLWQDGVPFTAEDVVFTFQKLTDPAVPTPYGGDFEKVLSVTAPDPLTVKVVYKEPFSPGLASWGMGIVPRHLLEKENLLKTPFSRRPVGTGPYMLKSWKTGERIDLVANPRYFEGAPDIGRYVFRVIPDQATSFLELETENLDSTALSPLQFAKQTDSGFFREKYAKYRYPSFGYVYIGYNLKNPLFSDVRVRRAIGLAIDKEEIIRVTLMGLGRVSTGPFLPGTWAYNDSVRPAPHDPAAARRLLAEAGWTDTDGDGIVDKDGRRFSFTILTNQGNDQRRMACEIIQKRLAEVGVEMKIQVVEWGTFLKEFIDKQRFEAVLLAWQLSRDPDIFDIFHSSKANPGEFNFISYKNEEVDRLLEEGRRLFPENERAAVYRRLHEILASEEPYTFLYVPDALPVVHRRFRGVEVGAAGIGHNFIRWTVPEDEARYDFS
ncbi:MAG TPA: peptide-binding protein [Candidatus Eisenbacteria bacterium]|nr:peptide-binding protein [Candidatus Eisenbacteria bacterium]